MTNTSSKTDMRQLLTEDIDAQIAELRAKKQKLAAAGRALVAAADEVDAREAAVVAAQKAFRDRRQELIELGMKPRAISRLLKELRSESQATGTGAPRASRSGAETETDTSSTDSTDSYTETSQLSATTAFDGHNKPPTH